MKKTFVLLTTILLFPLFANTQSLNHDRQPALWLNGTPLQYNGDTLNPRDNEFKAAQDSMLFGVEWYTMSTFGKALGTNINHGDYITCKNDHNDPNQPDFVYFGLNPDNNNLTQFETNNRKDYLWHRGTLQFLRGLSISYDPRLRVGYEFPKTNKGLDGSNPRKKQSVFEITNLPPNHTL